MEKVLDVFLISCHAENRRTLFGVFQDLPVNAHSVFTLAQAMEFISGHRFDLVFCEEKLPDGSYREALSKLRSRSSSAQFILLMCHGEWDEYLEALRLGVEEVLRSPVLPIDIDLALIHSARNAPREFVCQV